MAASRLALRAHQAAKKSGGGGGGELPAACVSPWRGRSAEENRAHFVRMKQGRYAEGEAFLRMKGDLNSDNSALWDPAAYRVMFHAHPRTGAGWCIYPTYDYTHCIVDSLEDITPCGWSSLFPEINKPISVFFVVEPLACLLSFSFCLFLLLLRALPLR